uniref:Leucine-rich repeat domain-containing protein n=1 Tax=uncultured organism MedDCM-OCT-S08-C695 TaxID=743640 RepID=D6PJA8_9ZZZZ|nr:hypothetical protein [uncultured organism MedDCM-OCT-S08-C695]
MGRNAFQRSKITSIVLPDSLKSMDQNAFYKCEQLKTVTLGKGLTEIGQAAFYRTAITSITFPDSLESIGSRAFMIAGISKQ